MFDSDLIRTYPRETADRLQALKEEYYSKWLKNLVESGTPSTHPAWLRDLCQGPDRRVVCWPIMFTRGYTFHTYDHGQHRGGYNYGVCVKGASNSESTDGTDFYGMLERILQVEYPGTLQLKTILFKCSWYDTSERGMRRTPWNGIEINPSRGYPKNDPFILSSQADQVCFVRYPSVKRKKEEWYAVVNIKPRGVVPTDNVQEIDGPLQEVNDEPVFPLQLEGPIDSLARGDIPSERVNEAEQHFDDAEGGDEFDTNSPEDDSTSTDQDSL